ncbi:sigma-70 family RNA polymerase sigma factor [Streptococcus pyogenes]|nr:sigma-70 family RNA polymerase sigma factor [Streptococcus pyogenes]
MDKKEYFLYVKGKAVKVNEEIYRAYWRITEHEKYLQRKDWKYNVLPFSVFDYDGHLQITSQMKAWILKKL